MLAQKLRTLNFPAAVRGSTLPRFEAWWETNGFKWLKDKLATGESPLAAHQTVAPKIAETKAIDKQTASPSNYQPAPLNDDSSIKQKSSEQPTAAVEVTDIFADMLADMADEVLNQH